MIREELYKLIDTIPEEKLGFIKMLIEEALEPQPMLDGETYNFLLLDEDNWWKTK